MKTENKNIKILFFLVTFFLFIGVVVRANSIKQLAEISSTLSIYEVKTDQSNVNETTFTEDENDINKLSLVVTFYNCVVEFNNSINKSRVLEKSLAVFSPPPKK